MKKQSNSASTDELAVGCCISTLGGFAIVQGVHPLYYEAWQNIPQGRTVGDLEYTLVSYKLICSHELKPKVKLESANRSLCNLASARDAKKVAALLADPKVKKKFDALPSFETIGVINTRIADLPSADVARFADSVSAFSAARPSGFVFDDFARAMPELCDQFRYEFSAVPAAGHTRFRVHLFHRGFVLDDQRRRVFADAKCQH